MSAPVVYGRTGALAGEPRKSLVFTLPDSHLCHVLLFNIRVIAGCTVKEEDNK